MPTTQPFRCDVIEDPAWALVAVHGEVDLSTVSQIEAALRVVATVKPRVVLDLRAVRFLDASGVRTILAFQGQAEREGFEFFIVKPPPHVLRVFVLTHAMEGLRFVDVPEDVGVGT